jgi:pilus assembly protein Flp/PilA
MADFALFVAVQVQSYVAHLEQKLNSDERGQGMVEYGLILALIAAASVAILHTMGTGLSNKFTTISTCVSGGAC